MRAFHTVEMSSFQGQGLCVIRKQAQKLRFPLVCIKRGACPLTLQFPLQMHIFEDCVRSQTRYRTNCTYNREKDCTIMGMCLSEQDRKSKVGTEKVRVILKFSLFFDILEHRRGKLFNWWVVNVTWRWTFLTWPCSYWFCTARLVSNDNIANANSRAAYHH